MNDNHPLRLSLKIHSIHFHPEDRGVAFPWNLFQPTKRQNWTLAAVNTRRHVAVNIMHSPYLIFQDLY
jgi:hypothetical protein